jgi:hypothetical protein
LYAWIKDRYIETDDTASAKKHLTKIQTKFADLSKRIALNLNHLTLPEIKDFNALRDAGFLAQNAKRETL